MIQLQLVDDVPVVTQVADPLDINTGDILGIGFKHLFGKLVTACTSSVWTHTGVAWRDPDTNQLYVCEAAHYGGNYTGVFRIPFDLWLRINKNQYLCHLKYKGPPLDPYRMKQIWMKYENIKLDSFNWHWYRLLQRRPYIEEQPKDRHYVCYEVTIMFLQQLGIVQKKYQGSSYFAKDIIWRHVEMEPGYSYENPVTLLPTPSYK